AWLERFGTAPMWMSPMYLPLTPGFFSIVAGFFVIVLTLRSVRYAYESLGVSSNTAILLLFATLIGSVFNIPITELPPERVVSYYATDFFGMRYAVPALAMGKAPCLRSMLAARSFLRWCRFICSSSTSCGRKLWWRRPLSPL